MWHLGQRQSVSLEVFLEVLERLDVRRQHLLLGVGDEDDPVRALEHQLAGLVVEDLPRHRVELYTGLHPPDFSEVNGQEIEEQRPVGFRCQREHLALDRLR